MKALECCHNLDRNKGNIRNEELVLVTGSDEGGDLFKNINM